MWNQRLGEFVTLFLVINPFGVIPVYLALVASIKKTAVQREIALNAVIVSFVVLAFFLFAGGFLLEHLKVPLRAFQIAGGIVLFLVALEMVRGDDHAPDLKRGGALAVAIFPLAIPKIAGPAAMLTIVLISDDDRYNLAGQLGTLSMLAAVLVIQLALLLIAAPVTRVIGLAGAGVISRIMGMLLAALAVSTVLGALAEWLNLPKL